jgi:hypothetical protein
VFDATLHYSSTCLTSLGTLLQPRPAPRTASAWFNEHPWPPGPVLPPADALRISADWEHALSPSAPCLQAALKLTPLLPLLVSDKYMALAIPSIVIETQTYLKTVELEQSMLVHGLVPWSLTLVGYNSARHRLTCSINSSMLHTRRCTTVWFLASKALAVDSSRRLHVSLSSKGAE